MRNLCDAASMSCEVAALLFQAHANYGTWSVDFAIRFLLFKNSAVLHEYVQYNNGTRVKTD